MQGLAEQYGLSITIDNENPAISEHELITPEILKKYM